MPVFAPDASVILKWVLPPDHEPFAGQALALRDSLISGTATLVVPSLWYFEVGNTLARKYPETAPEQLSLLRRIGLREYAWSPDWQMAIFDLTQGYEVTFYDASYHALAMVTGGRFVTADEKHLAKARDAGHQIHLRDWRTA